MDKLTLVVNQFTSFGNYYQEWKASTVADIASIPTSELAVGSNVLVADNSATFKQWNGTEWISVI